MNEDVGPEEKELEKFRASTLISDVRFFARGGGG